MSAATLFGLGVAEFKDLALLLTSPALAIAAVYVFGVDLAKLPFISADIPYKIPPRFIQIAACLLTFLLALSFSIWLTLRLYSPAPAIQEFMLQFFRDLSPGEADWLKRARDAGVTKATVTVKEYDGFSDARVFVNNIRVFGTHFDCRVNRQCKKGTPSPRSDFDEAVGKVTINTNLYKVTEDNPLPLPPRSFERYLLSGAVNYIDIFVNNSGLGECNVLLRIDLETSKGDILGNDFHIVSARHDYNRFRTRAGHVSYRVCDQVRLELDLR